MKQSLFFLFLLLLASPSRAQQLLGFQAGYSHSNILTDVSTLDQRRYRAGIQASLGYEYLLKKHFYLGAGCSYAQWGFQVDEPIYNLFSNGHTTKVKYDYITMPLRVGYRRGTKRYFFAGTGLVPAVLVKAQAKVPFITWTGTYMGTEAFNITEDVNPFDLGWMLEAGAGMELNSRFRLQASLAYQQSFTTVSNQDHLPNTQARHRSLTACLGLKYQIPRKQMDNN